MRVVHQTKASQSVADCKGLEEGFVNHIALFTLTKTDAELRQCFHEDDHVTVEVMDEQGQECVTEVTRQESLYFRWVQHFIIIGIFSWQTSGTTESRFLRGRVSAWTVLVGKETLVVSLILLWVYR